MYSIKVVLPSKGQATIIKARIALTRNTALISFIQTHAKIDCGSKYNA